MDARDRETFLMGQIRAHMVWAERGEVWAERGDREGEDGG
jgi:hypothetical protein